MQTPPTKTCNTCHNDKPLSAFRKNIKYSDGRLGKCIACEKEPAVVLSAQKNEYAEQYFDDKKGAF